MRCARSPRGARRRWRSLRRPSRSARRTRGSTRAGCPSRCWSRRPRPAARCASRRRRGRRPCTAGARGRRPATGRRRGPPATATPANLSGPRRELHRERGLVLGEDVHGEAPRGDDGVAGREAPVQADEEHRRIQRQRGDGAGGHAVATALVQRRDHGDSGGEVPCGLSVCICSHHAADGVGALNHAETGDGRCRAGTMRAPGGGAPVSSAVIQSKLAVPPLGERLAARPRVSGLVAELLERPRSSSSRRPPAPARPRRWCRRRAPRAARSRG